MTQHNDRPKRPGAGNEARQGIAGRRDVGKQTASAMRQTLNRLNDKRLSFVCKFSAEDEDDGKGAGGHMAFANGRDGNAHKSGSRTARPGGAIEGAQASVGPATITSSTWDEMEYSERQNSVRAWDLFRYARKRELVAIIAGITFMIYAASWQPISVFILAIMASLMGLYSKQTNWLRQLNSTSNGSGALVAATLMTTTTTTATTTTTTTSTTTTTTTTTITPITASTATETSTLSTSVARPNEDNLINEFKLESRDELEHEQRNGSILDYLLGVSTFTSAKAIEHHHQQQQQYEQHRHLNATTSASFGAGLDSVLQTMPTLADEPSGSYESFSFLKALYSFVTPFFDLSSNAAQRELEEAHIKAAVHDILEQESGRFLRKSFEINGSAFVLALSQLLAFFLGMSLITWAAKKQASRIKLLYFNSCLHQEITWFEAIDSASGSGSSLNGLVEKYQDGIGVKLALLCYFLGHVGLFALTAFHQMASLASFCMPFVLIIGLVIAYLSDLQANSIGEHALFAKRSLQLAEEIIAAIRTVFAFNGQQKEITRYSLSLDPVYRKSLVKHLYTALNTSLSKFSIFACFAIYCFYAKHLFPPHSGHANSSNKATILAVMRGAEVSIVNILISIPFLEALQQSKGSIARIFVAIERRSRINAASTRGLKLDRVKQKQKQQSQQCWPNSRGNANDLTFEVSKINTNGLEWEPTKGPAAPIMCLEQSGQLIGAARATNQTRPESWDKQQLWLPSISFRMVLFDYADRSGPTRRRSTLPFLNLATAHARDAYANTTTNEMGATHTAAGGQQITLSARRSSVSQGEGTSARRRSVIDEIADETIEAIEATGRSASGSSCSNSSATNISSAGGANRARRLSLIEAHKALGSSNNPAGVREPATVRRQSALIRNMLSNEVRERRTGAHRQILHYFNLDIEPGQSVALVGPSGSGKSTVLALVQRLYDVSSGQLLIGQHDVRELNVAWLRNQIGLVGQEPRLFDMSIAENIMLGLSDREFEQLQQPQNKCSSGSANGDNNNNNNNNNNNDQEADVSQRLMQQVVEAARAANAHDFIVKLPRGYATRVGSGGVQLSGGQKQRIAIARALIRKPKILLLDECTSALDTESEAQVHSALKRASAGRTTLIVAHRLETIKHVDLIVVMNSGQVVACGKHQDLLEASRDPTSDVYHGARIYRQLYEEQSKAAAAPGASASKVAARSELQSVHDEAFEQAKQATRSGSQVAGSGERELGNDSKEDEDGYEDEDGSLDEDEHDTDSSSLSATAARERPGAWQLWQFLEMPKWSAVAAVLVCLLAGLILPLNLIAHSYLFSVFAYNELEQIGDYLQVFGLLILSFSAFVFIVSFLQVILPGYVGEKLSIRLRVKTMESLLQKPMFYFDMDSNSAGAICDRFNSYISSLQNLAGTRAATMLEAVSTLTVGAFFGFGKSFSLSMFCLSFALLVLLTTIIESRIVERESSLQQRYDAQLAHLMADALSNIKTIASLNKEKYFIQRFSHILRQRERGIGLAWTALHTFLTSLKFVMPALSWSASMFYGSYLLANERIDLQTIYIVCPVVLFAVNDTFRALVFLPELIKARKSIQRLYHLNREFSPEVLQMLTFGQQLEEQNRLHLQQLLADTESGLRAGAGLGLALEGDGPRRESDADADAGETRKRSISFAPTARTHIGCEPSASDSIPSPAQHLPQHTNRRLSNLQILPTYMRRKSSRLNSLVPRAQARGRIDFKEVEFAYPNRPGALVLDNFSLSIAPGESVALVGTSGSGKSTTVAILEKFYDYHGGSVTLDGRDLRVVEPNWVRAQIGLVQQEACLLSYTIGDNIRYGDNGRFVSMDEVVEAARTANIHDFIMSLPDQYDTELSSSAYSSCQLSGGQRQRIAIARALIRNAPILVFDEATSALDNKSEQVVQDALNKAKRGRTSLTIAHRLATVKGADKIVVMQEGRVVEMGKHEELCRRPGGFYRSLWERQGGASERDEPQQQAGLLG